MQNRGDKREEEEEEEEEGEEENEEEDGEEDDEETEEEEAQVESRDGAGRSGGEVHKGYMAKTGAKGLQRGLKKRWFVLKPDVLWYPSTNSAAQAHNSIICYK